MAISIVGHVGQNVSVAADTTLAVTVGVNGVASGHRLLVGFVSNTTSSDGAVTCRDSKDNIYALDEEVLGALRRTCGFSAAMTTPLVSGDTITVTVPVSVTRLAMDVIEVSGIMEKDVSANNSGNSNSPIAGPTATRATPDAVSWAVCGWSNTVGGDTIVGTGAFGGSETTVESFASGTARYLGTMIKIAPAPAGTHTAAGTITSSQNWSMLVVAYGEVPPSFALPPTMRGGF